MDSDQQWDAEDPRPWERPGAVRRDRASHRAQLLRGVGVASCVCAFASPLVVPGVVALLLAKVVRRLADRDLAEMRAGRMDPSGKGLVELASDLAAVATMLASSVAALLGLGVFLLLWASWFQ
jgi:hypothetical protein